MTHTFTLRNGDQITVTEEVNGPLGVDGFRLNITALRGQLSITPSSGNQVVVSTHRALIAETVLVEKTVKERDSNGGIKSP